MPRIWPSPRIPPINRARLSSCAAGIRRSAIGEPWDSYSSASPTPRRRLRSRPCSTTPAVKSPPCRPGCCFSPVTRPKAQPALADLLQRHTPATLLILNVLDWSHLDLTPYIAAIDSLNPVGDAMVGEEQRMVAFLRESRGPAGPGGHSGSKRESKETRRRERHVADDQSGGRFPLSG